MMNSPPSSNRLGSRRARTVPLKNGASNNPYIFLLTKLPSIHGIGKLL
jgi:hypothetical protein